MPDSWFFEYTQGAFPDGTPRPLSHGSLQVGIPTMVEGQILQTSTSVELVQGPKPDEATGTRIIPGTRYVETENGLVANALQDHPHFEQVDPPKKAHIDKQVAEHADDVKRAQALVAISEQQEETAAPQGLVTVPDVPALDSADSGQEN